MFSLLMRLKEHFLVLDWLRGIAALIVLSFHWFDGQGFGWASSSASLAVDFFFALSGFVIAYAYDARLANGTMSASTFLRLRFIRLYPMIALGTLVGLLRVVLHDSARQTLEPAGHYAFGVVMELLLIPDALNTVGDRAIFLMNGPAWSLFFEIFGNLVYILTFRPLNNAVALAGVVILGAVCLTLSAYATPNELNVGWSSDTFIHGFSRIIFSFFAGIGLYRLRGAGWTPRFYAGPLALSLVLVTFLIQPQGSLTPAAQLVAIFLVFPAIVILGAGSRIDGWGARGATFLANLSYPLYLLHEPLIWMMTGTLKYLGAYDKVSIYISGGAAAVIVITLSWAALEYYDDPMRRWLTTKLIPRRVAQTSHST